MSIRAAVVGLGGIAGEHFAKLAELPEVEVVGICDTSPTLVEAVGERFGVGGGYTDFGRMLAETRPDAVHVLTPPATHAQLVTEALDAGAHVFVEKPIAPSHDAYRQLREAAVAADRLLVENLNYRFTRAVLEAAELLRSGRLGTLVNLDVTFTVGLADRGGAYGDDAVPHFAHELPGGALRNFASHPASLAVALAGRHSWARADLRRLAPWGRSPDELRALVGFEDVTAALTITSHARPPVFRLAAHATGGALEVDVLARRWRAFGTSGPLSRVRDPLRLARSEVAGAVGSVARALTSSQDPFEGFRTLLQGFYGAVAGAGDPPLPEWEMDAVSLLVDELLEPA